MKVEGDKVLLTRTEYAALRRNIPALVWHDAQKLRPTNLDLWKWGDAPIVAVLEDVHLYVAKPDSLAETIAYIRDLAEAAR